MVHGLQKRYELSQINYPISYSRVKLCGLLIRLSCLRYNKTCGNRPRFSSANVKNDEKY